jgi:hypothetical protein
MRYDEKDRESENVEDRRGQGGGGFPFPGGGIQIPIGGKGGFSLTTLLIIGAIMWLLGMNPLDILLGPQGRSGFDVPDMPRQEQPRPTAQRSPFDIPGLPTGQRPQGGQQRESGVPAGEDTMGSFVKKVLADTEDVWAQEFKRFGKNYEKPPLVLFSGYTQTACGMGQAAMGPFYCPLDRKVYIDLRFYDQLKRQFGADGDFAQAYVIAHEVGHHIQTLLGISDKVMKLKSRMGEVEANQVQVMMELQADCLAGVWANLNHQLNNRLEPGDIQEGLNAAKQIGDDMIQRKTQGHIVPDAFTHGTSEQRMRWFTKGFKSGEMQDCDTFNADSL